ncbi:MAG TPA: DUF1353 domain-containing protein [Gemmataceae bacterium]|nr:DUF1353 domain-containing protein [Gemmataceae bacterium]
MTIETPVQGGPARSERQLGFPRDTQVDVRQIDDQDWEVLRALVYHATSEDFEVPVGEHTDFASVPRVFVWFIPRYGRYTKAAILHDYLCSKVVPAHTISRIEADGIFRQAMRELGVPFLRRWIMWAAVRLGALTNSAGREKWWTEAWRVALVAAIALPVVAPAAAVIAVSFLVFYFIELLFWIPLEVAHGIRERRHRRAKKVNRPELRWKL